MTSKTIIAVIKYAREELDPYIENSSLEIRAYLSFLLKKDKSFLISDSDYILNKSQFREVLSFINRRKNLEPYPYITGVQEFFGLNFKVNHSVLIPRPETEILVEKSIEIINQASNEKDNFSILELGVGTGCISIALANYFKSKNLKLNILGIEKSEKAFIVAEDNLKLHKLEEDIIFKNIAWENFLENNFNKFDLIISNPPYVESTFTHNSIKHEPDSALYSGSQGLNDIRFLLNNLKDNLFFDSEILFEIGEKQASLVEEFIKEDKFYTLADVYKDLAKLDRVVRIKLK